MVYRMEPATVVSNTARDTARAASAFLATLRPDQRALATIDFNSEERENWEYVPKPRAGLPRQEMSPPQLTAADALLAASLSESGFDKARAIIQHELLLGRIERSAGMTTRFARNPGLYFFSVFGSPGSDEPWGWRVDGHHVSLNFTVVDGEIVSTTPSFFGANPAEVKQGPQKGLRILKGEEDLARELFLDLEPEKMDRATLYPVTPQDIITRSSCRVEMGQPTGLPAELMSADQRERLMSLVKVYIYRKPADVARAALKKVELEDVNRVHFGWAGSHYRGQPHYYRIHGPSFFVEYDNIQNTANHIHSVWRDVNGDFGLDVLRDHYREHHA